MGKFPTFEQYLTSESGFARMDLFIVNLVLAAVLAFLLGRVYVRFGNSLSNRKAFSKNFMLLTMTTMLIICIVKSSLALSLGLVGALSIVRFRAAIKEPEELAYLFLAIAIGLGLGAFQTWITLVAFGIIVGVIVLKNYRNRRQENQNLLLTVNSHNPEKIALDDVVGVLKKHCSAVDLKRFDETKEMLEAAFLVEFDNLDQLNQSKSELQSINEHVKITFLDNRGLI